MTRVFAVFLASTLAFAATGGAANALGAERTWKGRLSDEVCGASHRNMAAATKMSDRDCTSTCTRSGAKFVLIVGRDRIVPFMNPEFAGLEKHLGEEITVRGERVGESIFITKVESTKRK
jgi:hypothetical protein